MIFSRILEIFAPINCLGCGFEGDVICTTCLDALSLPDRTSCYACGRTNLRGRTCEVCLRGTVLAGVSVAARYDGVVKELILRLKFHRLRAATETAAKLLLRTAQDWPEVQLVTSVPVAASRHRERGYNQSELLAKAVALRAGLPYQPLLGRLTATHQIGLDRRNRLEQASGAFYAIRALEGQKVLLVDDVVTTGATLSACADALRSAGAGSVWAVAVARH